MQSGMACLQSLSGAHSEGCAFLKVSQSEESVRLRQAAASTGLHNEVLIVQRILDHIGLSS